MRQRRQALLIPAAAALLLPTASSLALAPPAGNLAPRWHIPSRPAHAIRGPTFGGAWRRPKPSGVVLSSSTVAQESRQFTNKKRVATIMAFMTGWADYLFVTKYNFFATMMTGNSMKMAVAFVEQRYADMVFFAAVICSYILGVGTFRRAELSYKDKALNGLFAPLVAGAFVYSDYLSWANPANRWIPASLLAFSWGIVNQVGSEVTGTLVFVVTGAMTRISNMLVDRISRTSGRKKIPKEGFLMSLSVISGFIFGAGWSAFLQRKAPMLGQRGAFSIIGALYGLLFLWLDREQLGRGNKLCEISADEVDCN